MSNTKISISVLQKLPAGHTIIGTGTAEDMSGKLRNSVTIMWTDRSVFTVRTANFDIEAGEYLGDCVDW